MPGNSGGPLFRGPAPQTSGKADPQGIPLRVTLSLPRRGRWHGVSRDGWGAPPACSAGTLPKGRAFAPNPRPIRGDPK